MRNNTNNVSQNNKLCILTLLCKHAKQLKNQTKQYKKKVIAVLFIVTDQNIKKKQTVCVENAKYAVSSLGEKCNRTIAT